MRVAVVNLGLCNLCLVGNTTGGFNLRFLQSSEFSFETARGRLMNLFPGPTNAVFASVVDDSGIGLEGSTTELQHLKALRCGSSINLNSNVAVSFLLQRPDFLKVNCP